jgi:hypothetical protein
MSRTKAVRELRPTEPDRTVDLGTALCREVPLGQLAVECGVTTEELLRVAVLWKLAHQ